MHPNRPGSYSASQCSFKQLPTFDAALDEYFSKMESQRLDMRILKEKAAAWKKVEAVREHLESQTATMLEAQEAE